jgi:hypothetical protein
MPVIECMLVTAADCFGFGLAKDQTNIGLVAFARIAQVSKATNAAYGPVVREFVLWMLGEAEPRAAISRLLGCDVGLTIVRLRNPASDGIFLTPRVSWCDGEEKLFVLSTDAAIFCRYNNLQEAHWERSSALQQLTDKSADTVYMYRQNNVIKLVWEGRNLQSFIAHAAEEGGWMWDAKFGAYASSSDTHERMDFDIVIRGETECESIETIGQDDKNNIFVHRMDATGKPVDMKTVHLPCKVMRVLYSTSFKYCFLYCSGGCLQTVFWDIDDGLCEQCYVTVFGTPPKSCTRELCCSSGNRIFVLDKATGILHFALVAVKTLRCGTRATCVTWTRATHAAGPLSGVIGGLHVARGNAGVACASVDTDTDITLHKWAFT